MDILKISLENYLSFKRAVIECDRDGIYLVIGKNDDAVDESDGNGAGKTGFISAIRFAFFGNIRGVFNKELLNEDVIHKDENDEMAEKCEVEAECFHGGVYYRVNRSVRKTGAQSLELYLSGDRVEWTCATLKAGVSKRTGKRESGIVRTQDKIRDLLGFDDELFSNSAYFEQSNIDTFSRGSLSDKDNVFKVAIGISRWSDYGLLMKDDLARINAMEKSKSAILEDIGDIEAIDNDIESTELILKDMDANKKTLRKSIKDNTGHIKKYRDELTTINQRWATLSSSLETETEKKTRLVFLDKDIVRLGLLLEGYSRDKDHISDSYLSHRKQMEVMKLKAKELKEQISQFEEVPDNLQDEYEKVKETELLASARMARIQDDAAMVRGAVCPIGVDCSELTDDKKKELQDKYREDYKAQKLVRDKAKIRLDKIKERMDLSKSQSSIALEFDSIKQKYLHLKNLTEQQQGQTKQLKELRDGATDKILEQENEAETIRADLLAIDRSELDNCKTSIRNLELEIKKAELLSEEYQSQIDELSKEESQMSGGLVVLREKKTKYEKLKAEFQSIQDEREIIKNAAFVVNKDIPHILITQSVPEVQDHVREFLQLLSGGRLDIEFRMTKSLKTKVDGETQESNAFDPWVCIDGRWLKYQQTSGGERARVDVAIHLAWVCFIAGRAKAKIETLFLDEVGAALDRSGIDKLIEILKTLMDQYGFKKIFYITQSSYVKKMLDNRILVTKTNDGSRVEFI